MFPLRRLAVTGAGLVVFGACSASPPAPAMVGTRHRRLRHGLWKSLEAQRKAEAGDARKRFEAAWANADVTLGPDLLGAAR